MNLVHVDILYSQMAENENGLTKDYFDAAHRRDLSFYNMSFMQKKRRHVLISLNKIKQLLDL